MRSRIVIILISVTLLWGMVIGRAAYLQLVPDQRLANLEKRQFETAITLSARRGDVLDRNGRELAASIAAYSLFADPKLIENPRVVAARLALELKQSQRAIEEKLRGPKRRFVWLARGLDRDKFDAIDAWLKRERIRGIGSVTESRRLYPNEKLLSQVLGVVGREERGLEGLELQYDRDLRGESRIVNMRRDARGRPLVVAGQMFNQAPEGNDIELTIDRELQFVLEQELSNVVEAQRADSAVGVVLDAQTSEVLAMASAPLYDINLASESLPAHKRNRAVTDPFEPGSTMKTFVIAGALDKKQLEPNSKINCEGGTMRIGKRIIREADAHHKFNTLSVSEVLAYSSNVGASKIALKLGSAQVSETLNAFGFGQKTGIDLPGESRGITQPTPWRDHLLANISFGHGIATTALQVANAYAVIANGGWLKQPFIVKRFRDRETGDVKEIKPKTLRRVISDNTVAKMRMILAGVTTGDGTGINARVPGFPVAGKTGTAQKAELNGRGYGDGAYVSSFAGFIPANDPKYVIYIAVDHPRKEYYGAAVAAPVFANVAGFAVRRAGLAPVLITQNDVVSTSSAINPLSRAGVAQRFQSSTEASRSSPRIQLDEEKKAFNEKFASSSPVPELAGLALRDVISRVSGSGVRIQVHGDGFVVHTDPAVGALVGDNKTLHVYLAK